MTSVSNNLVNKDSNSCNWSEGERQARVDLAALHHLEEIFGWTHLIYNHTTLRVPGEPGHFLVKPNHLLYDEITASSLIKVDMDGRPVDGEANLNPAGLAIHSAVLRARPDLNCVMHVHTLEGMAMSAHPKGLLPLNQGAARFYNRLSYHDWEGPSGHFDERERLARSLGPTNKVMILRNHGLLATGVSVAACFHNMEYLIASCRVQLMLDAATDTLLLPSDAEAERAARNLERIDAEVLGDGWPALLRLLERKHGVGYRA